jgi:type I restriction enzyme, R subunit
MQLEGVEELEPTPVEVRAGRKDAERDLLSLILNDFNHRFGTDWTDNDKIQRFLFKDLPEEVG